MRSEQPAALAPPAETPIPDGSRPGRLDVDRLTKAYMSFAFHGWKSAILTLLAGIVVSFLLFGLWWPYWRIADQDLILAYQGLLFNDGLPQEYFDHTGYLSYLAIGAWYALLHDLGLLPIHALSEFPPMRDTAAFDAAWQRIIEAGRVQSLIIGLVFVWSFAALMRRFIGDWRIAYLAAVALAFSGGIAMHMRVMRTELLSSAFTTTALVLVLLAARRPRDNWAFALLGLVGVCSTLAVVAKVQALFVVLAIPVIALPFGERTPATSSHPLGETSAWMRAALLGSAGLAAAIPVGIMLQQGIDAVGSTIVGYHPLGGGLSGIYQLAIGLWVIGLTIGFCRLWRISIPDAVAAMGVVAIGVALGLLSLHIRYHPQNLIAVANPVEHMFAFAAASAEELKSEPQVLTATLAATLAKGIGTSLANHSFVFRPSHRPTLLLEWLTLAGMFVAWRRGDRLPVLQAGVLILVAWGLDAVFALRGLKQSYFAYSDPLLIIAAAVTLVRFPEAQGSLRAQKIMIGLFFFYILWAHAEPLKAAMSHKDLQDDCYWFPHYLPRIGTFPFCRT